jgi:S-DNA-T family DNA segregation ATPase FtsK/SpoIIIE
MSTPDRPRLSLVPKRDADYAPDLPEERHDELDTRPDQELDQVVYEGEILSDRPVRTSRLPAVVVDGVMVVRSPEKRAKAAKTVARGGVTVAQGWHSWLVRAYDSLTFGVYRRQIRAAEAAGDREALADWTERKARAVAERRTRLMELPQLALNVARFLGISLLGALVLLLALSIAVWATGVGSFGAVWELAGGLLRLILTVLKWAWPAAPLAMLWAAWREGRRRNDPPRWLATSADTDVDVVIDETTIARALGALRIPQINAYLKQGLPLQFLVPARKEGRGTYAELRLPMGVTAEQISKPDKRAGLAAGLYRATKEVWPSTGGEAGILKLWIANKGALAEGAGPYPLLADGVVDVFKGVPFGKTLKGDPIVAPLMERNTLTGGMPGQGKSSSARVIMAGAALDPTAELRIAIPDTNFDFEVFRRRCSRYVMGAEDEKVEWILWDLRELYEEVQARGALLVKHEEPAVTRALASAGVGLHPLFYLLEEAHLAIQHKEFGEEISQLLCDIVKLGRKRGIHMIVSTQAPTKDSMPRDVTRNCSNGVAFAVGDHVANDALLGQGAYRAGHRATELIPGTDVGTAVVKGFTGERSDLVQAYFLSVSKRNDQVTPIIDRSLAAIEKLGTGLPGRCRPPAPPVERDLLEDLAEVLGGEPIGAADVKGLLVNLAPQWQPYKALTVKALVDRLAAFGVKVPSTGNRWLVDPAAIRDALARRSTGGQDGEGGAG